MDLDVLSIVLFLLALVFVVFLLRRFFHIVGSIFIAIIVLFVALFVLKDMLHFPVNKYADVSSLDRIKVEGYGYIEDRIDKYKGEYYEIEGEEGSDLNINDEGIGRGGDLVLDKGYRYKEVIDYEDMGGDDLEEFIRDIEGRVEDNRFREKLTGMSKYVDIVYDLGNGLMRNSDDRESVEVLIK